MSNTYPGDTVRLKFNITPFDSEVAVLGEISLTIRLPDGTQVEVDNGDIVESADNRFYYDYLTTTAGRHNFKYVSSGTVDAVEFGLFDVKANVF